MRDLIAENAKFVLDYGHYIIVLGILLCLAIVYVLGKGNSYLVPKGVYRKIGAAASLLAMTILILVLVGLGKERSTTGKVLSKFETMVEKEAPSLTFQFVDVDSSSSLESYEGQIVILNFWATWCVPCREEMPVLSQIQDDYADQGVTVITLSDQEREIIHKYGPKTEYSFLSVFNTNIEWLDMRLGTARPVTFFIDRTGVIKGYYTGARDYEFFSERLEEMLGESP